MTYCFASAAALFFSSSLYFVAVPEVYLIFGSWIARAAVPPCDWKNFVADSLPPTFMVRSWSHCHSAYPLHHYSDSWEIRIINAYGQDLLIWQRKYELLSCDDLRSNRDTNIYQTAPKTRLGFWFRSQNIPIIYQRRGSIDIRKGVCIPCSQVLPSIYRRFFVIGFLWQRSCCKEGTGNRAQVPTKESNFRRSWMMSCYRGNDRFGLRNLLKHSIKITKLGLMIT